MKVPNHHDSETVSMSHISNATRTGLSNHCLMDKGRQRLSPSGQQKKSLGGHRTFGVPLHDLVLQAPHGCTVPYIVKKICTYIEHHGLESEGIFRVNGSQRVVEMLKGSFDRHGDANLEESNDVMAVAGLLKLFLRELPDSVIPEAMTRKFVNIQEEHQRNAAECVAGLRLLLQEIPRENYDLLKHIVRFLAIVTCNETVNKMSPMALAIVFGPNLFRCGKGFVALKDQGSTNQIVYRFIVDYNSLFKDAKEDPPAVYWERKINNQVPPRPPPPKFNKEEAPEIVVKPIPSIRKSKMKNHEGSPDHEDQEHSESSISSRGKNSYSHNSPNFSDDEMTGRLSPFHFDSDSGFSLMESPVPSARTSECVDKAIKATVIGHLFGEESSLLNVSIDTTIREDSTEAESQDVAEEALNEQERTPTETKLGVKERARLLEQAGEDVEESVTKPTKQQPNTKMTNAAATQGETTEEPAMGSMGFAGVSSTSSINTLQNFKKPAGPQNRRSPSRRLRQGSDSDSTITQTEEDKKVIPNGHLPYDLKPVTESNSESAMNNNNAKISMAFLDLPLQGQTGQGGDASPDKSPLGVPKPFVPPLDFSTLHENVGGQDPILAHNAQSVSYQWAKQLVEQQQDEEGERQENEEPSPHTNKVKRKAGTAMEDEDLLPFSHSEQDQYKLHSHGSTDDELTSKMKAQMRKIQSLKKKIKNFEETFEHEHGYKPSHSEKASKPEVKKFLVELSRARKEAKRLKEEAEMGSRSRHGSGASSTGERTDPPDLPPTMAQTLDLILRRLKEKRKETFRPEDIELMSADQVQEEKLSIQKALLHFEGIHGRPKSKDEKDLMRPLYDRYRTIKRLLSRQPMSPRGNIDLPTVPEDQPIDIHSKMTSGPMCEETVKSEPIRVPTAVLENYDEVDEHIFPLGTLEFAVTRDLSILKTRPVLVEDQGPHSPKARRKLETSENIEYKNIDSNLHELSVPELHDQLLKARNSKKILRKTLRYFEENFIQQTGRKVGREDRIPMQTEYTEYKQLKARLKLLEALLSKHTSSEV